jgi:hypothetical protein
MDRKGESKRKATFHAEDNNRNLSKSFEQLHQLRTNKTNLSFLHVQILVLRNVGTKRPYIRIFLPNVFIFNLLCFIRNIGECVITYDLESLTYVEYESRHLLRYSAV